MNSIHKCIFLLFYVFFPPRGFQSCYRECTCRAAPVVCWIFQELGPGCLTIPWIRAHLINASKSKSHFYLARFRHSRSKYSIRTLTLPSTGSPATSSSAEAQEPALKGHTQRTFFWPRKLWSLPLLLIGTDVCMLNQSQAEYMFFATSYAIHKELDHDVWPHVKKGENKVTTVVLKE